MNDEYGRALVDFFPDPPRYIMCGGPRNAEVFTVSEHAIFFDLPVMEGKRLVEVARYVRTALDMGGNGFDQVVFVYEEELFRDLWAVLEILGEESYKQNKTLEGFKAILDQPEETPGVIAEEHPEDPCLWQAIVLLAFAGLVGSGLYLMWTVARLIW